MLRTLVKDIIHEQHLIESKLNSNFKRWFGKSKMRKGGNPIICYHGTNVQFNEFDINRMRKGWLSTGFYFTQDKSEANHYGKSILSVYLRINNPFIVKGDTVLPNGMVEFADDVKTQIYSKYPNAVNIKWKDMSKFLQKNGHDGIVHGDNLITVFDPNQVKSIENDGSWDTNDNNIYS